MVTVLGQWGLWRVGGLEYCPIFLGWESCAAWWELLEQEWLQSMEWCEWCLWRNGKGRMECDYSCSYHGWGHPLAEGWHELLQWLEEECKVCLLKLLLLSWCELGWDFGLWSAIISPMSGTIIVSWVLPLLCRGEAHALGLWQWWTENSKTVSWLWNNILFSNGIIDKEQEGEGKRKRVMERALQQIRINYKQ